MSLPGSDDLVVAFVPSGKEIVLVNEPVRDMLTELARRQPLGKIFESARQRWGQAGDSVVETLVEIEFLTDGSACTVMDGEASLVAWLQTTYACNYRCHYCYQHQRTGSMSPAIGRAAVDAIIRSAVLHGMRRVKIKYGGGEPLLNLAGVLDMQARALTLARHHGIELEGVVLSNGSRLNDQAIRLMLQHSLRLVVSLDGLGEVNDRQRVLTGGQGSFDLTCAGIELAIQLGLIPSVSITVSNATVDGLPDLVAWLLDRGLLFSVNFYRTPYRTDLQDDQALQPERVTAGMRRTFALLGERLPQASLQDVLLDRVRLSRPHAYACGAGRNYLVIDSLGRIAKCQMEIDEHVATVMTHDPLTAVRQDLRGVQNVAAEAQDKCRECDWRGWCAGGCPLMARWARSRYDGPSPSCQIYQQLVPEVVRLEGMRLLQYTT